MVLVVGSVYIADMANIVPYRSKGDKIMIIYHQITQMVACPGNGEQLPFALALTQTGDLFILTLHEGQDWIKLPRIKPETFGEPTCQD